MTASPNYGARPPGATIDLIVIHGTGGTDASDLSWIRNPESRVSYHYLILRDGTIYSEVPEEMRAWHAGVSEWEGRPNCNDYSIGIGLSNRGPGEPYTEAQYDALDALLRDIIARRGHLPVVGHCDVSPGRKTDPWPHFDWSRTFAARTPDPVVRPVLSVVRMYP